MFTIFLSIICLYTGLQWHVPTGKIQNEYIYTFLNTLHSVINHIWNVYLFLMNAINDVDNGLKSCLAGCMICKWPLQRKMFNKIAKCSKFKFKFSFKWIPVKYKCWSVIKQMPWSQRSWINVLVTCPIGCFVIRRVSCFLWKDSQPHVLIYSFTVMVLTFAA